MKELNFKDWHSLEGWLREFNPDDRAFAFRGQADSRWPLKTSLARHFLNYHVAPNEWRTRELKMYREFREQLLKRCDSMYRNRKPLDILSLMQHHSAPTRLLDFSYDPRVAAFFALEDSRAESAIWVVNREDLAQRRAQMELPDYCGPTHDPVYRVFEKGRGGQHRLVGAILEAEFPHGRLVAQRGCFFVPGSISETINPELIHAKITLSKRLSDEAPEHLKKDGYERDTLFPDLDRIAQQAKREAVRGTDQCACEAVPKVNENR